MPDLNKALGSKPYHFAKSRFLLTSAMIEALSLKAGDLIQVFILGIFKEPNETNPIPVNIPMVGRVIKTGGTSLGMTVKQNLVKRLELQENYDLLISIEKLRKSSILLNS